MDRSGVELRRQLLLWAGVVAVALCLLAMHQLSINHTAADPTRSGSASGSSAVTHGPLHQGQYREAAATGAHSHVAAATLDQHPDATHDGCPACAEHQAMALTCLIALVLLAVGWALRVPAFGRGLLLPRLRARPLSPTLRWRRPSLTPAELSISRT